MCSLQDSSGLFVQTQNSPPGVFFATTSAFLKACEVGRPEEVRSLLLLGADVNWRREDTGWSGLHLSANNNNRDVLDLLLSQPGVNVNISSHRRTTPLMVACFRGHADIVRRLRQVPGADLNCGDTDGWTAAHAAVYKQQPRCVEELRMAGAGLDWNTEDSHGRRPLTMAVELGLADVLQTILSVPEPQLDLSVTDGRGRNVGQIAVESSEGDRQRCVELLCQDRRVDWNVKNRDGDTPVMFCIKQGLTGLARCLINTPQVDLDTVDRDGKHLETVAKENDVNILSLVCRANVNTITSRLPECPVSLTSCVCLLLS